MYKRLKKYITIIIVFLFLATRVNAASMCDYKEKRELNQKAGNIKVNYEIVEDEVPNEDMLYSEYKSFDITILNVTKEFYIKVNNNYDEIERTYTYEDAKDGVIKFKWYYIDGITNFNIQVVSSDETSCPDERYKTLYLTTPRFNEYYYSGTCQLYPELDYCQEFVMNNYISEEAFSKKVESFEKKNKKKEEKEKNKDKKITDKIFDFLDKYKWIIVGSIVLVIGGILVVKIIKNKNKKKRELGL